MKFEIELTKEQEQKFGEMKKTRNDRTDQELLMQVLDRGLYDICYRTKRNKQQWAERKEFQAWKKSQGEVD